MKDRPSLPLFLSIEETCRQLGNISRASVNRLLRDKRLASTNVGRRRLIISHSVQKLTEEVARGE